MRRRATAGEERASCSRDLIGGSAVVEGVMMRGTHSWSVAVRDAQGRIYAEDHDAPARPSHGPLSWPVIRGCVALCDSLRITTRAAAISARHAGDPRAQKRVRVSKLRIELPLSRKAQVAIAMILGLLLGLAFFVGLPVLVCAFVLGDARPEGLAWNGLEALVRAAVLVAYLWLLGCSEDTARTFAYHGAEHKAINCLEGGGELTPAGCAPYPRYHARCGTSLAVCALLLSVLVNAVIPASWVASQLGVAGVAKTLLVMALRLASVPLVAGIAYELNVRWASAHLANPLAKLLMAPGLLSQRLTTREPTADMLECAIVALENVHARDLREAWEERAACAAA